MSGSWVRSCRCWDATRSVRFRVGCGGAIWGCGVILGLDAVMRSGVRFLLLVRFFFFFFFWKWFEGKLGDGFWTMGRNDLGWSELG